MSEVPSGGTDGTATLQMLKLPKAGAEISSDQKLADANSSMNRLDVASCDAENEYFLVRTHSLPNSSFNELKRHFPRLIGQFHNL
jgi:hypothetical protein